MSKIEWQYINSNKLGNIFIQDAPEIFKSGGWALLAREVIQNSLDALRKDEDKLKMEISLDDIPTSNIPNKERIIDHLNGTIGLVGENDRCYKFCKEAIDSLNDDVVRIMKISDYNTTGVTGSSAQNGDPDSKWNALIYDEGNSKKDSDQSTGSFGTGKNAPFAISSINTVFYSTKDEEGCYATEGVSKLFTSIVDNNKLDNIIYYAKKDDNGQIVPLNESESADNLDKYFQRSEVGTDVMIVGVNYDKTQIMLEMIQAVVENFFILLVEGKLDISICDEVINKDTLWSVIDKYCAKPIDYTGSNIKYGYVKQYLNVYTNSLPVEVYEEEITGAGKLRLMISKDESLQGKYVAMFRNNGMKIYDKLVKTAQQNFSAIFSPADDDVDRFLRSIENPKHDYFDPETVDGKAEKKKAKDRYALIERWIKTKVEEYTKIMVSDSDYLDGMEEYIQLDDEEPINSNIKTPELEIIELKNNEVDYTIVKEGDTSKGTTTTTIVNPKSQKSNGKNPLKGGSSGTPGNGATGLISIHNDYKIRPKVSVNDKKMNIAFSLDNFNNDKFDIIIESIGEDNSTSDFIPKINSVINENTHEKLNVIGNKIIDVPFEAINVISVEYDIPFASKYKINVCEKRGESDEN